RRSVEDFVKRYGPWALVAGASEGIGAAFARALAQRGVHLVLVARRSEGLEAARREIESPAPVEVRCVALDLARADAPAALEQAVADLDVGLVVYNGALAPGGAFLELALAEQLAAIDVNVRAPLALAHPFGRRLAGRGRGPLLLSSSSRRHRAALVADPLPGLAIRRHLRRHEGLPADAGRGPVVRARAARCRRARGVCGSDAHAELSASRAQARARGARSGSGGARGPRTPRA